MQRFWDKVKKGKGCWEWTAANSRGYGKFRLGGKTLAAHRVSYEWANGPIPDGLVVMHTCDNPPCVRPAHLRLGTHGDNAVDRDRKGRARQLAGEAHPRARLTDEDVEEIRRRRKAGETYRELAEAFGVSRVHAGDVANGRRWKHVC